MEPKVKRTKSPEQALSSLMNLCARGEKCSADALRLMKGWGVGDADYRGDHPYKDAAESDRRLIGRGAPNHCPLRQPQQAKCRIHPKSGQDPLGRKQAVSSHVSSPRKR